MGAGTQRGAVKIRHRSDTSSRRTHPNTRSDECAYTVPSPFTENLCLFSESATPCALPLWFSCVSQGAPSTRQPLHQPPLQLVTPHPSIRPSTFNPSIHLPVARSGSPHPCLIHPSSRRSHSRAVVAESQTGVSYGSVAHSLTQRTMGNEASATRGPAAVSQAQNKPDRSWRLRGDAKTMHSVASVKQTSTNPVIHENVDILFI